MPIWVSEGGGSDFAPAPEGLHQAVCVDVIDLGVVKTSFGMKHQIRVVWQVAERNEKGDRFQIRRTYTPSLFEGSNLRRDLESWRGKAFTQEQLNRFDVEALIGANCQIQVVHRQSGKGRTYANVQAIVPPPRNAQKLLADNYKRETSQPAEPGADMEPEEDSCPF
jgi:hypothetical protein